MEDGVFFYDYNVDNPISFQIEMIRSFCPNMYPFYHFIIVIIIVSSWWGGANSRVAYLKILSQL